MLKIDGSEIQMSDSPAPVSGLSENKPIIIQSRLHGADEAGVVQVGGSEHLNLPTTFVMPQDLNKALADAAVGFASWDVLDAAHMLVASLIVDLVSDNERPGFLRKMDRILRDRVKEIGGRQKPKLVI